MLSFPPQREFISQLRSVTDSFPSRPCKLELIKLWQKAFLTGQIFEESITEFIFKLPDTNQVQALDFILNKLTGEEWWHFDSIPWWVCEITGYDKKEYEKHLVARYAGLNPVDFDAQCHELAIARSADVNSVRMDVWSEVISVLKSLRDYYNANLTLLDETEVDVLCAPLDYTVFALVASEIAHKRFSSTVLELSKFYSSLLLGYHSFTEQPHVRWIDYIYNFCSDLTSEFTYSDDDEHNEIMVSTGFKLAPNDSLKKFLSMLASIRNHRGDEVAKLLNPDIHNESNVPKLTSPVIAPSLPWQGSKAELAELGYALLEAGLISGPRESALKTLANFFGQDLGNPAKHLQTLQKRKWNPGDKEPPTPLLDRLGAALKGLLKGKAIAPSKK
jgi:hypothetical protein